MVSLAPKQYLSAMVSLAPKLYLSRTAINKVVLFLQYARNLKVLCAYYTKPAVFNLGYAYPWGYAKTS
jgi:hypothetical protein